MSDLEAAEVTVTAPSVPQMTDFDLGSVEKKPEPTVETPKEDSGVELLRRQLSEKQREAEEIRRQKRKRKKMLTKHSKKLKHIRFRLRITS